MEVYVRSYPALGSKFQVSQNGGSEPIWSRDGRELFFRSGGAAEPWLVSATIEFGVSPRVRSRQPLDSHGPARHEVDGRAEAAEELRAQQRFTG